MDEQSRKVSAQQLVPGMTVRAVTRFSNDYSYLDRNSIAFLRERFAGALCEVVRGKVSQFIPVEALQPLDALQGLVAPAADAEVRPLDEAMIELLRQRGLREFEVLDVPAPPKAAPPRATVAAEAKRLAARSDAPRDKQGGAPAIQHGNGLERVQRVAEARVFLERVAQSADQREEAARLVQDLFAQGRTGKYSTKPADQAVQEIVSQGLSKAMVAVAGLRASDQTYAHCVDTAVIFQESYADILRLQARDVSEAVVRRTLLAGFCHDIGKSTVPREILDSTVRFERDSREMRIMRGHAAAGAQILSDLGMDKSTVNVAGYHHVKVDGTLAASYPDDARWEDVLPITRLAAVVDVYQALIGKRSYKKNWVPGKAVEYLQSLRGKEFDPGMLDSFVRVMGRYPVGSLVRLSSGDLAFVLAIGTEMIERPVVAVVENAAGELLTHNGLIDLMDEHDLSIVEIVDHYTHYPEDGAPFRVFSGMRVT